VRQDIFDDVSENFGCFKRYHFFSETMGFCLITASNLTFGLFVETHPEYKMWLAYRLHGKHNPHFFKKKSIHVFQG